MRMMMIIPIQERLYLFVHDQDHPAAAPRDRSDVLAVYSYIGMSAVIPCKPAHPEFQVRLRKDSLELYDGAFDHIPTWASWFLISQTRIWRENLNVCSRRITILSRADMWR